MTTFGQIQEALRSIDDRFITCVVRRSRGRRIAVRTVVTGLAGAAALLATSSTAFAYWTAHGSGSGTVTAGSVSITIPGTATASGVLYPGASGVAATMHVTNPASSAASLTLASVGISASLSPTTCNVSFTPTSPSTLSTVSIAPGSSPNVTVGTFSMGLAAPAGCHGQTFTVGITVSGQAG